MKGESEPHIDSKKEQFLKLRDQVHEQMKENIRERKENNPVPTEQEIYLGTFVEEIEPQVRDAVLKMLEKGYELTQSGFRGVQNPELQFMSGYFSLGSDVIDQLRAMGVEVKVKVGGYDYKSHVVHTEILFRATSFELEQIKQQWDMVVDLLPPIKETPTPTRGEYVNDWREDFCPDRLDILICVVERELADREMDDTTRERTERYLKYLRLKQDLRREDLDLDTRTNILDKLDRISELMKRK